MRVLLLGSGGREHAMAWKLAQSPLVSAITSAPGNPGMAEIGPTLAIDPTDPVVVAGVASDHDIVVVGPEAPLAAGVANRLMDKGIPVFGPSRDAALLETSKSFAKTIMNRAEVETARAASFSDQGEANEHLDGSSAPYVVKADGLAGGKGVLVTDSLLEAKDWTNRILTAGGRVLIEEFLDGPELSVFALCNGTTAVPIGHARDYKRLGDANTGPNTGGMGAISPVRGVDAEFIDTVMWDVVEPVVATMAELGTPYVGILYVGLALTADGPKVIEFNCRFGDPETQVLLPRMTSDLGSLIAAAAQRAPLPTPTFDDRAATTVVLAADGYPEKPVHGARINGVSSVEIDATTLVFQAGTRIATDGTLVVGGGRVLDVVGLGADLASATVNAYRAIDDIAFDGMQYRSDIGEDSR